VKLHGVRTHPRLHLVAFGRLRHEELSSPPVSGGGRRSPVRTHDLSMFSLSSRQIRPIRREIQRYWRARRKWQLDSRHGRGNGFVLGFGPRDSSVESIAFETHPLCSRYLFCAARCIHVVRASTVQLTGALWSPDEPGECVHACIVCVRARARTMCCVSSACV
jgi:hypothetical protein